MAAAGALGRTAPVARRVVIVVVLLAACTVGHYVTPHDQVAAHEFLFKATYVPIILAGLWFGVKGGLATSAATSVIYLVHVQHQLGGGLLAGNLGRTLDIVLYNAIALVTGVLAESHVRARRRAEGLAEERAALHDQLEASYQALQHRTEELLETEDELRHADRLVTLGELAAGLAHEIRNPLSGLSGAAQVLCRDGLDDETRTEFSAILQKETDQLNRVVHDFLGFVSEELGQVQEADLAELMRRAAESVKTEAERHSVDVVVSVPEQVRVETTPILLEHVLLSLLRNAVDAMPDGGTVTLTGEARGEELVVAVRDAGDGIAPETQARLFEPFFTTKRGGVGLGLFIARRIARGLGGDIAVTSEPGEGTEFTVGLPLRSRGRPEARVFPAGSREGENGDQDTAS